MHRTKLMGFTLVELLVTIAVIAIIASVSAPSFLSMRDQARTRAAAEAVFAQVQYARTESIKQSRDLWVTAAPGVNWCIGISNAAGCDCNTAGSCQFGPAGNLMEHNIRSVDFSGITLDATATEIQFDSRRGIVNGTGNTLTVSGAGGYEVKIITSKLGRVRMCGDVGGGIPSC